MEAHSFTAARKIRVKYALVQNTLQNAGLKEGGMECLEGLEREQRTLRTVMDWKEKRGVREGGDNVVGVRVRLEEFRDTYYHRQSLEVDFERN